MKRMLLKVEKNAGKHDKANAIHNQIGAMKPLEDLLVGLFCCDAQIIIINVDHHFM